MSDGDCEIGSVPLPNATWLTESVALFQQSYVAVHPFVATVLCAVGERASDRKRRSSAPLSVCRHADEFRDRNRAYKTEHVRTSAGGKIRELNFWLVYVISQFGKSFIAANFRPTIFNFSKLSIMIFAGSRRSTFCFARLPFATFSSTLRRSSLLSISIW